MGELGEYLLKIDYTVLHWINIVWSFPFGDVFFPAITDLYKQGWFKWTAYPLILFFYFRKYRTQGLILFLGLAVTLAFSDLLGGQFVKKHFVRERPFQNQALEVKKRSEAGGYSFYSNHASNMAAFATYTAMTFPAMAFFGIPIALLIAYSRIYNGVHYPSDVLAGALVGILIAYILVSCLRYYQSTHGAKP